MNTGGSAQRRAKKLECKLMIENELTKIGSSSLVFHAGVIGQGLKNSAQPDSFNKVSVSNLIRSVYLIFKFVCF